jgi:hypothetical protein
MENNRAIKLLDWINDFIEAAAMRLSKLFLMLGFITGTIAILTSKLQLASVPWFDTTWAVVQAVSLDGLFFAILGKVRDTKVWTRAWYWYLFIAVLLGIVAALVNATLAYQELSGTSSVSGAMANMGINQSQFSYIRAGLVVLVSALVATLPRNNPSQDDTGTADTNGTSVDTDTLEQMVSQVVEQAVSREVSQVVLREFEGIKMELMKLAAPVSVVEEKSGTGQYLASDTADTRECLIPDTDPSSINETVTVSITDTSTSTRSVVVSGGYRDQIRGLILDNPSISNKEIIGTLGCGESTVKRLAAEVRKELGDTGTSTTDTEPLVSVEYQEPDKLDRSIKAVSENPDITDEQLAGVLELRRPASARFWRLKAEEILTDPQR